MLNKVNLIGKLKEDIYIKKQNGEEVGILRLEIVDDSGKTNVFDCQLPSKKASNIFKMYGAGTMIEVKGRLQTAKDEELNTNYLEIISEEVTPLK